MNYEWSEREDPRLPLGTSSTTTHLSWMNERSGGARRHRARRCHFLCLLTPRTVPLNGANVC